MAEEVAAMGAGRSEAPILDELVERLVAAYSPERIFLFGSRARGDDGPDSDYDLLLVVPDDADPARRRSRLAYEALRGTGTAVDVLVLTRSAFESRLHLRASLPATVQREGRGGLRADSCRCRSPSSRRGRGA